MPTDPSSDLVPRSEMERAVAEERRKLRKVQLALAVAVGFMVLASGAFAWRQTVVVEQRRAAEARAEAEQARWQAERTAHEFAEKERATRNAAAVEVLLLECDGALRQDDEQRAERALAEAERRLREGGADHLKARVVRCRKELDMLREFDEVDNNRWGITSKPAVAPPPREVKRP